MSGVSLGGMEFTFRGVLLSERSGALTDDEFATALAVLDDIEAAAALCTEDQSGAGVWDRGRSFNYEQDGVPRNFTTSLDLLMRRDREVIRKLRLYAQAFSGYQLAFLRMSEPRLSWIGERLPDNYDEFLRRMAGAPDHYAVRCLSVIAGLPEEFRVSLPAKFGEVGWMFNDWIVANYDCMAYICRVAMMHESGVLGTLQRIARPLVLEVGGGFGGLAYMLRLLVPGARYVIVDLPESLAFSAVYLSVLFPELRNEVVRKRGPHILHEEPGFTFVPAGLLEDLRLDGVDLAINTLSFAEMADWQVERYCRWISAHLAKGGVMFEQNNEFFEKQGKLLVEAIEPHFAHVASFETAFPPRCAYGPARLWWNAEGASPLANLRQAA